ncbi:hypothetical protein, partial [Imperialibacter sp. 75]|uniref:hypothetical protein n=1 Tax=Imperialibacter sp. 75 TaxID=2768855 RepID=UPI001F38D665
MTKAFCDVFGLSGDSPRSGESLKSEDDPRCGSLKEVGGVIRHLLKCQKSTSNKQLSWYKEIPNNK